MDDTVQQIKDRLSIVDVIGPYVKLTKSGKYYKGLSPFTKEKTASFFVSPDRGLYHCFSTGKGGDMFTFIQEMEGVDFRGALTTLAEKAGVEVVRGESSARDIKAKLYAALHDSQEYFEKNYYSNNDAQKYLQGRGLTEETIRAWHIGYAHDEWRSLSSHLQEQGYTEQLLVDAGLIKHPEQEAGKEPKRPYDRFRGRIMFPINDIAGRVVGFSGRSFGSNATIEQAKYLNSPETSVFNKSQILHGLDRAKDGVRKLTFALLVEGQVDLLMAHQAGYTNAVALSGTSFTEHHAQLIKRYTENLLIAFDGDRAGVAAAGRAAQVALSKGLNVKIATLPHGEDPADVIRRDISAWKEIVKGAVHVVDFYLTYIRDAGYDERRFKLEVSRVVLPYVALIENAIDRSHFIQRIADALSVPLRAVEIELEKIAHPVKNQIIETRKARSPQSDVTLSSTYEPFLSREDTLERLLIGLMLSLKDTSHNDISQKLNTVLKEVIGEERIMELMQSPDESRIALIEGDLFLESYSSLPDKTALVDELVVDFKKEVRRSNYRDVVSALRHAEKEGNTSEAQRLLKQVSDLAKEL